MSPSADLASIPDQLTNNFLTNLASSTFWTGGFIKYPEKTVNWIDGDQWTGFTAWAPSEPAGWYGQTTYIEVHTQIDGKWRPGFWNDVPDFDLRSVMCQYDQEDQGKKQYCNV